MLATGDRNGGIYIWESESAGIVYTLDEHKVRITGLSWRADGQLLASAADDGKFVLWDMKDGWPTRTASPHAVKKEPSRYTRKPASRHCVCKGWPLHTAGGSNSTVANQRQRRWRDPRTRCPPIQAQFGKDGKFVVVGTLLATSKCGTPAPRDGSEPVPDLHPLLYFSNTPGSQRLNAGQT